MYHLQPEDWKSPRVYKYPGSQGLLEDKDDWIPEFQPSATAHTQVRSVDQETTFPTNQKLFDAAVIWLLKLNVTGYTHHWNLKTGQLQQLFTPSCRTSLSSFTKLMQASSQSFWQ